VTDIKIGGDTLLVEDGDLPGELFMDRPERVPLRLGRLRAREELVVQALYIGPLQSAPLVYEVTGSETPTSTAPADSAFLAMSTGVPIFPAQAVQITGTVDIPRGYAFLPEEVILRDPEKWVVNKITIGSNAHFAMSGDVPGILFGAHTRGCKLSFPALYGGRNEPKLVMVFTYVGSNNRGEGLCCGIVGRIVREPSPVQAPTAIGT